MLRKSLWFFPIMALLMLPLACKKGGRGSGSAEEILFEVRSGESTSGIAKRLDSMSIISHPEVFTFKAKLRRLDKTLKQGIYRLHKGMSDDSVLLVLASGRIATIAVTIPEGMTLGEIALKLSKAGVVSEDSFLKLAKDKRLLSEFNVPFKSFEGLLFPDTYSFPVGISEEDVIRLMVHRFFEVAEPFTRARGLDTLVILASIVEKEAYLDEERPVIASVFLNRLRVGMKLESCATVEYALPKHKESLTYGDLRVNSPYNTYSIAGLPPGPICSPGKASLEAVAHPKDTRYYFFVSKGDGSHYFSETAKEHERMKNELNHKVQGK
jgi:UPF0755 protein